MFMHCRANNILVIFAERWSEEDLANIIPLWLSTLLFWKVALTWNANGQYWGTFLIDYFILLIPYWLPSPLWSVRIVAIRAQAYRIFCLAILPQECWPFYSQNISLSIRRQVHNECLDGLGCMAPGLDEKLQRNANYDFTNWQESGLESYSSITWQNRATFQG